MTEQARLKLDALVQSATVQLQGTDGAFWGSGFFVAPGWVLTAAHVPRDALGRGGLQGDFTVVVEDRGTQELRQLPARVGYLLPGVPERGGVPLESDLALVRVPDEELPYGGEPPHGCVWLTDRGEPPVGEVRAYGWFAESRERPAGRWTAGFEVSGHDGDHGMRLNSNSQIPKGASGSPVVDLARGCVVGVIKRGYRSSAGDVREGGLAADSTLLRQFSEAEPVDPQAALGPDPYVALLRLHDAWHEQAGPGSHWPDVQRDLPQHPVEERPQEWGPDDVVTLLGHLSRLPEPRDPQRVVPRLVQEALQGVPSVPGRAATWREGHGRLHLDLDRMSCAAIAFLGYARLAGLAARAESPEAVGALLHWVSSRSRRLSADQAAYLERLTLPPQVAAVLPAADRTGGSSAAPDSNTAAAPAGPDAATDPLLRTAATHPGDGPTVVLELEPALWRTQPAFHWYLRVQEEESDELVELGESGDGVPRDDLAYVLQQPLTRLFTRLDTPDRKAPLEVALPADYFDLAVQHWVPHAVAAGLDGDDPAYRPLGAQRQVVVRDVTRRGEPDDRWMERWKALSGAEELTALRTPPEGRLMRRTHLAEAAAGEVPVLCRPVRDAVGRDAMELALECGHGVALWHTGGHAQGECQATCQDMHEGVSRVVRGAGSVRELPEHLRVLRARVNRSDPEAQWARRLAILYDDASRPLPEEAGTVDSP